MNGCLGGETGIKTIGVCGGRVCFSGERQGRCRKKAARTAKQLLNNSGRALHRGPTNPAALRTWTAAE